MRTPDTLLPPSGIPTWPPRWLWLACGAFWLLLTLVGMQSNLMVIAASGRSGTWTTELWRIASGTGLWFLATPFIVTWSARHPVGDVRNWRWLVIFAVVGVLGITLAVPTAMFLRDGASARFIMPWRIWSSPTLLIELLQYAFFIAAGQLWASQRRLRSNEHAMLMLVSRTREMEAHLADARLQTLRMHVHPHFVFNALNAVTALQRRGDTRAAIAMLVRLGELMRLAMDEHAPHTVSLARELETLEHYLAIERERFGDRLVVELLVDTDTLDVEVPYLILQPLVENAIRHGLARLETPARITIRAGKQSDVTTLKATVPDAVRMTITNDVPTIDGPWTADTRPGRGLRITRQRLDAMFGGTHGFSIDRGDTTVTVSFLIPRTA